MEATMIDFSILVKAYPALLKGTLVTLYIALFSSILGFVGGTILGFMHCSSNVLIRKMVSVYVTIMRGTPMLIQISFIYFLLPQLGIQISALFSAIFAIGLNSIAYISQIIKSGISSIDQGHIDAAQVLGLNSIQTMRYIIFPQAIRIVMPALVNEFITLIKDSSLASFIGVVELFKASSRIISYTYDPIPIYCAIAAIYLVLTTTLTFVVHYIERKMNYHVKHS